MESAGPESVLEAFGLRHVRYSPLDPRGHPWLIETDDWQAVLRRSRAGFKHVQWLHRFLARLAAAEFPAPRPMPLLGGASLALLGGTVWEVLSLLPGKRLVWTPTVPLESAGALLARFHLASLTFSPAEQRPEALPLDQCHPVAAQSIARSFHEDLADVGYFHTTWCVLHGDCTSANMLIDEQKREVVAMIDFELAHMGPPEADISFALWVIGRTEQPAVTLDDDRIRAFVKGYHKVRALPATVVRAIPLYLVGRGLQMHVRMERVGRADEIQMQRLRWLHTHRPTLEDVVASALEAGASSTGA
ncbi:MAG: phosphotransferase enzyme family protein [Chloroflexota bacterium]